MTTGEGGMVITDDNDLYINAFEYHDHGHDHDPNVGRGLEQMIQAMQYLENFRLKIF